MENPGVIKGVSAPHRQTALKRASRANGMRTSVATTEVDGNHLPRAIDNGAEPSQIYAPALVMTTFTMILGRIIRKATLRPVPGHSCG